MARARRGWGRRTRRFRVPRVAICRPRPGVDREVLGSVMVVVRYYHWGEGWRPITHRVQAVLSEERFEELSRIAEERHRPLSVLIRDAVEAVYLEDRGTPRRREVLDRMLGLQEPVADWEGMEEGIIRGAGG